jgi:hypothetical protein
VAQTVERDAGDGASHPWRDVAAGRMLKTTARLRPCAKASRKGLMMTIGDQPQASASKFAVIFDGRIQLAVGGDIDRTLDFNLRGVFGAVTQPAIIFFNLANALALDMSIRLNDRILSRRYLRGPERSVHEVIGPAVHSGANQLTFRVQEGSCPISDIVLWHQVRP